MQTPASADGSVRLVQITDCHLGRSPGSRLVGMDTDASLRAVLALLDSHEADNPTDMVIASGDLADEGAAEAYARLVPRLDSLAPELCWLPGNHDRREHLLPLIDAVDFCPVRDIGAWRVICLDSQVPGAVGGALADTELHRLDAALQTSAGRHVLIALHHQVLPVGCAWLDRQRVANSDALWRLIQRHPNVRVTLSGHVHQDWEGHQGAVRVLTSPSTCVQFRPASDQFALDTRPPGYRWLQLHADGRIDTGVARASGFRVELDHSATGY